MCRYGFRVTACRLFYTPKNQSFHDAKFVVADRNTGHHNDNLRCRQKLRSWWLSFFDGTSDDLSTPNANK